MEPSFWTARWQTGQIGFHEGRTNAFLEQHRGRLPAASRVLVPLCGKAFDLAYLAAHGHAVVGVELVEDAVAAFFREHDRTPTITRRGPFVAYQDGAITVYAGDFFATTPALLGRVDAVYDRAALIALPPPLRTTYVRHLRALMPATAPALVVTVEYPPAAMEGPPFSVLEAELRQHYPDRQVTCLGEVALESPRLRATGAVGRERCFVVEAAVLDPGP